MNDAPNLRILIVDDEESVRSLLRHTLQSNGFEIIEASNAARGIEAVTKSKPDLVLLDFGLPDQTGLEVLRRIREWTQVPVIFLTVRNQDQDKVAALDAGADDYITKPFSTPELLARIRVALRHGIPQTTTPVFRNGPLEVDRSARIVRLSGVEIKLTSTEYQLLSLLINHVGKMVSHRVILKEIWGPSMIEHHHYVRVYFGHLRKKFEQAQPGSGQMIENESGVGYRLLVMAKDSSSDPVSLSKGPHRPPEHRDHLKK